MAKDEKDTKESQDKNRKLRIKSLFRNPSLPLFAAIYIAVIYVLILYLFSFRTTTSTPPNFFSGGKHVYNTIFRKDKIHPKDIVIVEVDDKSSKELDLIWQWRRGVFADLLDKVALYKPKTIALDFAPFAKDKDDPEGDIRFEGALRKCGNVILLSILGNKKAYLGPNESFAKASAGYGMAGIVKPHGVITEFRPFVDLYLDGIGRQISFEIKAAAHYLDIPYNNIHQLGRKVTLESSARRIEIPTDQNGFSLINYTSDTEDIRTFSAWEIIKGVAPKEALKGKLVLIIPTVEAVHDSHNTPLGTRPGGLALANVINSVIIASFPKEADSRVTIPLRVLIVFLGFFAFYKIDTFTHRLIAMAAFLAIYIAGAFIIFLNDIVWPVFDIMIMMPMLFLLTVPYHDKVSSDAKKKLKKFEGIIIIDKLTTLYTYEHFRHIVREAVEKCKRKKKPCSLIRLKITNLDKISKATNYEEGLLILQKMAEVVKERLTKHVAAGRLLEKEELGMVLPKMSLGGALGIADDLNRKIQNTDFNIPGKRFKVIVNLGVSTIDIDAFPKTDAELMTATHVAVKRAEDIGPNRVCQFNPLIDRPPVYIITAEDIDEWIEEGEYEPLEKGIEGKEKAIEKLDRKEFKTEKERDEGEINTMKRLVVTLEKRDFATSTHSLLVGDYSEKIGIELQQTEEEIQILKEAGILHDIGKLVADQYLLRKEGKLTPEERMKIELHPEDSIEILGESERFQKLLPAIRFHQERLDGSGYPHHLKGNEIPFEAQVVAVADVFEALTSNERTYRKGIKAEAAIEELLSHDELYNRNIVLALKRALEKDGTLKRKE